MDSTGRNNTITAEVAANIKQQQFAQIESEVQTPNNILEHNATFKVQTQKTMKVKANMALVEDSKRQSEVNLAATMMNVNGLDEEEDTER